MDLNSKIKAELEPLAGDIGKVCRIKSVEGPEEGNMPFGKGCAEALDAFLETGRKMGFKTQNFDNYAGHIDFGEGEEIIGILAHVDVVPEGSLWDIDPWGGIIKDKAVWGRGTVDDKGPAMVCLYAMKILKESGVKLSKKVRLILGTNEETNWKCMDYYLNKVKPPLPSSSFSPDAVFPVTYAEKGMYQFKISKKLSSSAVLEGGNALNAVPSCAVAAIEGISKKEAEEKVPSLKTKCSFSFTEEGNTLKIKSSGKGGHAAELEGTVNAVSGLFELLSGLHLDKDLNSVTAFYKDKIGLSVHGENWGIYEADESGKLTFNVSGTSLKDGVFSLSCDVRIPVTKNIEPVIKKIKEISAAAGFTLEEISKEPPLYIPKDSPLVKTLMESYQKVTGDFDSVPLTAGGMTYSRCIPNCVAFGCILPGQENNIHRPNEHLKLEHMEMWLRIYLQAIYDLAK